MDRRVAGVVALITLLCCVEGCGGGGSTTTILKVTTTSLPNGTVGVSYTATLLATGGTTPYMWSQVSGGAMPDGVTLGSSGNFIGTPTSPGTFGPYVFQVSDSSTDTASSSSLSITISASALSVTTTSLPSGAPDTPYSATLVAAGGVPPYTWAETSGGALPAGLTLSSAGTISGTPTTSGSYGPYVFTVTDSKGTNAATQSLTLTITGTATAVCALLGNEAALTSATPYAFLLKGTDKKGNPVDIAGSVTPNGSGGLTAAIADYNGFTDGPQSLQVNLNGSSYAFGSSGQGCLYLAFSGLSQDSVAQDRVAPSSLETVGANDTRKLAKPAIVGVPVANAQFSFYLSGLSASVYETGRIAESDYSTTGTSASGFIHLQTPAAFVSSALQPNYAIGVDGWTANSSGVIRTAMAGTFTNTSGTVSAGYSDLNSGGTATGELTGGYGTLSTAIDATTGRGTGSYLLKTPALTFDFVFYVLNGSDLILLSTDLVQGSTTTPLLAGRALASNPSPVTATLSGYYLLASQGYQSLGTSIGNIAQIGTLNATPAGAIPTATIYSNFAGTYGSNQFAASTYTVDPASGRIGTTGLTSTPPVIYLTSSTSDDGIAGFLVGTDPQVSSGVLVVQTATTPAYSLASVAGNYAASTEEDVDGLNGTFAGAFVFDGTGGYTVTSQVTGTVVAFPSPGAIVVNADGSGNLDGGSLRLVTNGTVVFAIPSSGDPLLYVLTEGDLP